MFEFGEAGWWMFCTLFWNNSLFEKISRTSYLPKLTGQTDFASQNYQMSNKQSLQSGSKTLRSLVNIQS